MTVNLENAAVAFYVGDKWAKPVKCTTKFSNRYYHPRSLDDAKSSLPSAPQKVKHIGEPEKIIWPAYILGDWVSFEADGGEGGKLAEIQRQLKLLDKQRHTAYNTRKEYECPTESELEKEQPMADSWEKLVDENYHFLSHYYNDAHELSNFH